MNTELRRVPLMLPVNVYRDLEALAEEQERTPSQQAAWLVRRSLARQDIAAALCDDSRALELAATGSASPDEAT